MAPARTAAQSLLLLGLLAIPSAPARSADPDPFHLDPSAEALLIANAWGGIALARLVQDDYPSAPAWSDTNSTDDFFYRSLRRPGCEGRKTSEFLSDVGLAGSVPLSLVLLAAGAPRGDRDFADNAVLIAESTGLTMLVTEILKLAASRERPYSRGGSHCDEERGTDTFMSFPSGHTSLTFAAAVAASRIAHIRGYRHATAIQLVTLSTAIGTGYLRIAADRHYFSDVVIGALVGTIVSAVVVEAHRTSEPALEDTRSAPESVFRIGIYTNGKAWSLIPG
jgi:membrane-associated phospholipid phosphatase